MWFTFLRTIRGWFTDIPSWRGRDGIRIRESGLAGLIFRSELALESDGGAGLDGDGAIGDSTGITITRGSTAEGTTPGAGRFITGALTLVADLHEAVVSTGRRRLRPAGGGARPFDGNRQAARGYAAPRGQSGVRSGAFSGYDHGGETAELLVARKRQLRWRISRRRRIPGRRRRATVIGSRDGFP